MRRERPKPRLHETEPQIKQEGVEGVEQNMRGRKHPMRLGEEG